MNYLPTDLVFPLRLAEHNLLQLLIEEFNLTRRGLGVELEVQISAEMPTIWTRDAKRFVLAKMQKMPDYAGNVTTYQEKLDRLLVDGVGREWRYQNHNFPFRYASGGALPVVTMDDDGREYYCFFYREIRPVGWNIANGGCDSHHELLDPFKTVERELREELMIVDFSARKRYVFSEDQAPLNMPEFAASDSMWESHLGVPLTKFDREDLPVVWLNGPDIIRILEGNEITPRDRCFLNITTEDFGIEIDRVAKIRVPRGCVLLDGELFPDRAYNRIVGLFEVAELNSLVDKNLLTLDSRDFRPDRLFFNGMEQSNLDECLGRLVDSRKATDPGADFETERVRGRLRLCPIANRMVRRYARLLEEQENNPQTVDVFVSFGSEDIDSARRVAAMVRSSSLSVFFSAARDPDFRFVRAIDMALSCAKCMVVVGRPENFSRSWPTYEWATYHAKLLGGFQGNLVCFAPGADPKDLPDRLLDARVTRICDADVDAAMRSLETLLRALFGPGSNQVS